MYFDGFDADAEFVGDLLVELACDDQLEHFALALSQASHALRSSGILGALLAGGAVLGVLFGAVMATRLDVMPGPAPSVSVLDLGQQLMGPQVAALLVIGALLTVALLGAIVIASHDRDEKPEDAS